MNDYVLFKGTRVSFPADPHTITSMDAYYKRAPSPEEASEKVFDKHRFVDELVVFEVNNDGEQEVLVSCGTFRRATSSTAA